MLHKRFSIHAVALLVSIIFAAFLVPSVGHGAVKYGADIEKPAPVQYGAKAKRPGVRYGVDIRAEDIRQVPPGVIVEEVVTDFVFDVRNYIRLAASYDDLKDDPVVNPDNLLELEETGYFLEFNTQPIIAYQDDYTFRADVGFQYCPGPGEQETKDTHFVTNEFFFDLFLLKSAYFKLGKKRESWGVGTTFNPVDIMIPPKDPVDPSESREGAYLSMLEVPYGNAAFSLVYFPDVDFDLTSEAGEAGIPDDIDLDPDEASYGVRALFLLWDTDVSFIYYRTDDRSDDQLDMKNYYGLTLNRFWGDLGVYAELLGYEGTDMKFVTQNPDETAAEDDPYVFQLAPDDDDIYVNFALGANYTFSNDMKVGLEYLRNDGGYDDTAFDSFYDFLDDASDTYLMTSDEALKGNIKEDLLTANQILRDRVRQNYMALTVDRPNTFDDFFPHLSLIYCLDDSSYLVTGAVDYTVRDDTTVTLDVKTSGGSDDSEYGGLIPNEFKVTLKAKYYF
jgi:hypothetical protein